MKLPSWFKRKPAAQASLTTCPKCGREMILIDRSTMSGDDMRTYRCEHCQEEHIVNYGVALWKVLSDANKRDDDTS
jgi:predicted RNA-binding Zn-ribbon protein involved in translation (DUF1610 family)